MHRKVIALIIGCVLVFQACRSLWPEGKTIRHEVRQVIGGSLTPEDARAGAIARVKREVLEKASTHLESPTIVSHRALETVGRMALSMGLFKIRVTEENPFVEGGVSSIGFQAEVRVDLATLEERVRKLLTDREQLARLIEAERRVRQLLKIHQALEVENDRLTADTAPQQRATLQAAFHANANRLTALDWIHQALILWSGGGYDPADRAIDYYTRAVDLDPAYAHAYTGRGRAYKGQSLYPEAIADYDRAISLDPALAYAYNDRGGVYVAMDQVGRAIVDYDQAIRLDTAAALFYNNRGAAHAKQKQFERAIEDYTRAVRLETNYALFYNNRGAAYAELEQFERAIVDYSAAIRLDRDGALAYSNRGAAYNRIGQYRRALNDCDVAIRLELTAVAHNNRGVAYYNLQEIDQAIADYNEAIRLDPDDASTFNNRGVVYADLGHLRLAINDYSQAILRDPNLMVSYYARGLAYEASGQWPLARLDWLTACKMGYLPACERVEQQPEG